MGFDGKIGSWDFMIIEKCLLPIDGKVVCFRRLGHGRRKILFFHGFPGSSSQIMMFANQIERFDLEVLCIDRPGYNETQIRFGNQFHQVSEDAHAVMKHLGWTSCEVWSVSGGTPFLFAFAQAHSEVLAGLTVISGLGPVARSEYAKGVSRQSKWALALLPYIPGVVFRRIIPKKQMGRGSRLNPLAFFLPLSTQDQETVLDPVVQKVLWVAFTEAFRQEGRGPRRDAQAYLIKWSTDVPQYKGPITIWHGLEDQILAPEMAEEFSKSFPQSKLFLVPNEGHYSLATTRIEDILRFVGES